MFAETETRADLKETFWLSVGDVGQQSADEIQAIVAFAFVRLSACALDELVDDVSIRHTTEGEASS